MSPQSMSLAQLLYGLIAILGPNERKADCRPDAALMAFGPNLAPTVIFYLFNEAYQDDTTQRCQKGNLISQCQNLLQGA